MFKLNLKIAWRNLWKNKVYAAINIGGLALGLTAFVLMLLYINYEESYDTWTPDLENVYQIRERHDFFTPDNKEHWQDTQDSRIANLLRNKIPNTIAATRVQPDWDFIKGFSVKIANANPIVVSKMKDADSSFFQVFHYDFIQGDEQTALKNVRSVVLKESLAKKLFGTDKVLGKVIKVVMWRDDVGQDLTITGVVAEPKTPQTVKFNALMRTGEEDALPNNASNFHYCQVYAKFNTTDTAQLNSNLQRVYLEHKKLSFSQRKINFKEYYKDGKRPGLKAVSIANVHANPPFQTSWVEKLKPIVGISVFLLVISIINFVNLATAQSVQRAKEVGVKKVLGSYKAQLISQFLIESALQSVSALFLSIVLVEVVLPLFNAHFNVQLSFWHNAQLLTTLSELVGLFIIVTLLAGYYPAWILSNYNPVSVLKGNYENGLRGIALRNVLVVFQFVISVTFIIAIGVMHLQTKFISNKDLGFQRGQLINIKSNYDAKLAERLRTIPGVQYVGTSTQVMGNVFNVSESGYYKNTKLNFNSVTVSMDALPALGVQVVKGRIFSGAYKQDTINSIVINETAAKSFGKQVIGENYYLKRDDKNLVFQIVGVIKDYHNEGFDKVVLPTIYKVTNLGGTSNTNNLLVRFNTDNIAATIDKINVEWKKLYPNYPLEYETMDDAFSNVMDNNNRFINMVMLFSIISVSLSLLGLFALSTFVAKRRTKEIAVRKVLGASNIQIVNLLNKSFLLLVLAANIISWPIAYILIKKWLEGFAYRIDMAVVPFIIATLTSIVIAVLTVSIQARKAAVTNPVNALKYE
ncbi:ABC transporter permease [Pedobacter jejuensis]|uniref:FtsX-like permease family protein n=1 Tax=Pedobacter jejuensis TaxID=1268550 RepID=A0A3N0C0V9_9SPHI|nr:ABC transporter permease [Pedobacter jejuensis]RNL55704.1 FtsX-like permease family protein [Pedobacter jejuensis]